MNLGEAGAWRESRWASLLLPSSRVFWRNLDIAGRCENPLFQKRHLVFLYQTSVMDLARLLEYSSLSLKMQPIIPNVPVVPPSHQDPMQITTDLALCAQVGQQKAHQKAVWTTQWVWKSRKDKPVSGKRLCSTPARKRVGFRGRFPRQRQPIARAALSLCPFHSPYPPPAILFTSSRVQVCARTQAHPKCVWSVSRLPLPVLALFLYPTSVRVQAASSFPLSSLVSPCGRKRIPREATRALAVP